MANINAVWSNGNNWRLSTAANLVWTPQTAEPTPTPVLATPSGVCCPGPASKSLAWTPCLAAEPMTAISGFAGLTTRTRGERCATARVTWTTNRWTHSTWPSIGDTAQINGSSYFVDSSVYQDCIVVLQLCKPILECPDCLSQVRRLVRLPGHCPDPLISTIVAADVPTKVCVHDQIRRIVDGAEIQIISAQICLDTTADVQVGDLVFCNDEVWRIDRIESPCSSVCLLTLQAIKEPWNIAQPPGAEVYLGYAPLILPGLDVDAVGNLPNVYLAAGNFVLSGLQLEAEGETPGATVYGGMEQDISGLQVTIDGEYHSVYLSDPASVTLPAPDMEAEGVAVDQDVYPAHLDEVVSGFQAVGEGTYTEVYTGTADLNIAGLQGTAEGDYLSIYISDAAVVDLSGLLAVTGGVWSEVETPFGQLDQDIPGFQASGVGAYVEVYIGIFRGQSCGPWTTDLDEIVTDDLLDPIIFDEDCPLELPGLQATLTGEYVDPAIPPVFGSLTEDISGLQFSASTSYTPPPPQQGNLNEFISGLQFAATTFYADPIPPDDQIGSLNEFISGLQFAATTSYVAPIPEGQLNENISGLQFAATTSYTPPPPPDIEEGQLDEAISGLQFGATANYTAPGSETVILQTLTGGSYIDYGTAPSVDYPLGDTAIWRWDWPVSEIDDRNPMFLTLPLDIEQGEQVLSATLLARGNQAIAGTMYGTVVGYDADTAPTTDPGWDPNYVLMLMPRTTATIEIEMFASDGAFQAEIDLTAVFNEIFARPGWQPGNRILFLIETNGNQPFPGAMQVIFTTDVTVPESTTRVEIVRATQTALASPSWLMEAEDYPYQKLGVAYYQANYQTIFDWDLTGTGTVTTVNNSTELINAINAAKSNTNIKGVHLNPGSLYNWGADRLNGLYRDPEDAFFIRTTPGSATQAQVTQILEQDGEYAGIAFVDLDLVNGIRLIGPFPASPSAFVAEDILIERCDGWIDIQGQRVAGVITPGKGAKNIQIRLNTLLDHWAAPANNHAHGIFMQHMDGVLIEGNVLDHNGWDPNFGRDRDDSLGGPTPLKHNCYLARPYDNCVIRFNWNSRASSHGWHTKQGGHVYRNIMSCNPIAMQLGFGGDGMYGLYGIVEAPVFRDNLVINADNITTGSPDPDQPRGQASWWTCVNNALFDSNYIVYDRTSSTNSATIWLERDFPIHGTASNNVSISWNNDIALRGTNNFTPVVTYTNNSWNTGTISVSAQALAFQLGAEPTGDVNEPVAPSVMLWIDNYKASRKRLGVDIELLKDWMATIIGGITP